jgi:glycosyltransferase involved in cell wall biosynthesis
MNMFSGRGGAFPIKFDATSHSVLRNPMNRDFPNQIAPEGGECPFVSVVTPVYNGEPFLAESIESVLAQDYTNWEYIIVNNCSTDRTLEVAMSYARRDPRIRVVTNPNFVNCEENHNNAFRQISARSEYTKVVSADDGLLAGSLGKMVRFAMHHHTVGIVGSYQQSNETIKWKGLPENVNVLSGREACRLGLLNGLNVFGNPMSVLYRSELIRSAHSFFPHTEPHADTSACYEHLRNCDFGFIHEVLSLRRVHEGQLSTPLARLNAAAVADLDILLHYGPEYLSQAEHAAQLNKLLSGYYRYLGGAVLKMRGRDFWAFHKSGLTRLGFALDRKRVFIEAIHEVVIELGSPATALRKLKSALLERDRQPIRKSTGEPSRAAGMKAHRLLGRKGSN